MREGLASCVALCLLFLPASAPAGDKKPKHSDLQNIGERDINKGSWDLYSPEREIAMGRELARETELTTSMLQDSPVTTYVNEVAQRIVRHSDLRLPLQVEVMESDEADAFALPGGYFFISTGMILRTQTEAELAGIIAHEVAHVAARHATKQMTKAQLFHWLSLPLIFVGGPVAYGVEQGLALAVPLSFLKFSRDNEREADFLGQQYQYASGYDPVAFVDFFERIKQEQKSEKGGIAKAFSTHPMTKDRIAAAERTIEQILPPREDYVVTTSQYDSVRKYLEERVGLRLVRKESPGPVLRKRNAPHQPSGKPTTEWPF